MGRMESVLAPSVALPIALSSMGERYPLIKCYDFKVETALLAGHF